MNANLHGHKIGDISKTIHDGNEVDKGVREYRNEHGVLLTRKEYINTEPKKSKPEKIGQEDIPKEEALKMALKGARELTEAEGIRQLVSMGGLKTSVALDLYNGKIDIAQALESKKRDEMGKV